MAADDSPLYIFDGTFADRRGSRVMRRDYEVPPHFAEDLMRLAGDKRRPPYRRARAKGAPPHVRIEGSCCKRHLSLS